VPGVPSTTEQGDTVPIGQVVRHMVTAMISFSVLVAVAAQAVSYFVIANYLDMFDLTPEMLGISPLDAALQMRLTASNFLLDVVTVTFVFAMVLPIVYFGGIHSWPRASRTWKLWRLERERNRSARDDGPSTEADARRRAILSDDLRRLRLAPLTAPHVPSGLLYVQTYVGLVVILIMATNYGMGMSEEAGRYASDVRYDTAADAYNEDIGYALQEDLNPRGVTVHWVAEDAVPASIRAQSLSVPGDYSAVLVAATESRYALLFEDSNEVYVVSATDVVVMFW
jgi:hypothetical protein